MITDIIQTKTNFNLAWDVLHNGERIADAEAPFMPKMFLAELRTPDDMRKLIYDPSDTSYGNKLADRLAFRVFDRDHYVGHMIGRTQKVNKLFGSYPYYEYIDKGETYLVYEVGFGHKGLYLCFYYNNELICMVEKELVTVNFKDKYRCYMVSEKYLIIVTAFVIYYDTLSFGDITDLAVHSKTKTVLNTYQKELKAKYDPNFIAKIKAMDGVDE